MSLCSRVSNLLLYLVELIYMNIISERILVVFKILKGFKGTRGDSFFGFTVLKQGARK